MPETRKLQEFVEQIMSIQAPMLNMFGDGVPGNAGIAATATTTGMEITQNLKKKTIEFANACKSSATKDEILKRSKAVEGLILNEQLVNVLTEKQNVKLIDDLHVLVSGITQ